MIGDAKDQYTLIAGERRLNIYTELFESGKEEYGQLPAYIVGNADMGTTEQQLLIEASNLDTRDGYDKQAHYLRVVKLIKQYGTEQGLSCHEYTKLRQQYMKCSPRYARFYEQVFEEGTEALQEMVEKGEVRFQGRKTGEYAGLYAGIRYSRLESRHESG